MKKIIVLLSLTFLLFSCGKNDTKPQKPKKLETVKETVTKPESNIKWFTNIEDAMAEAQKTSKNIFVHFTGSDWCGWCVKLEGEVYVQPEFQKYAEEKLVMVKFDFPQNIPQTDEVKAYNQQMLQKFGVKGFPTVFVLDKDGKGLGKTGYMAGGPTNYINHINSFIAK